MLLVAVMVCAGAVPTEGSRWSWNVDDARSIKMVPLPRGVTVNANTSLAKATLEFTVLSAGESGPRRLKVAVKKGPKALVGGEWEVENNYGELVARNSKPPVVKTPPGPGQPSLSDWGKVIAGASRVVMPDPVVAFASGGAPCSEKTRAEVANATGVLLARVLSSNGSDNGFLDTTLSSTATCGSKPGTWSVKFKFDIQRADNTLSMACSATVSAPPSAAFASYQATCAADSPMKVANQPVRLKWNSTFKSAVTPLK